jgi:hypothetical protein
MHEENEIPLFSYFLLLSHSLMLDVKLLERQEQAKPQTSRRREIIKIRAEINEIETKKPKSKQNKAKQKTYKASTKQKAGS